MAYEIDGRRVENFPAHADDLRQALPIYETLPGWDDDLTGMRDFDELPGNAQNYLNRLAALLGRPVEFVSVGPDRSQTIRCAVPRP